ncbi:nitroreductase family protein [Arcobacter sp. LA11]|uniref:nitroreductase family protein n=1 Tax=Arcobacter sp. LA11 TaxID=1898176 RepID=UPI000933381D|nr:nitroreductase family protein [Arcobacter sp. LA11]
MNYNELKTLIQDSRTTRRFKKDAIVNFEDLKEILDLARITSSAKNMQPIKYILVTNKDSVERLTQTAKWAAHLKDWEQKEDEKPSAFILMLNDQMIDGFPMFDAGASFTAISLAAKAKGLATCPMASIDKELCKELFVIPDCYDVMIGIAVGVGAENIKLVDTKKLDTNYYRLEDETHCVPKRTLEQIIVGEY